MDSMQHLKDPLNNRKVPILPLPVQKPLRFQQIFKQGNKIDCQFVRRFLKKQGRIARQDFHKIIQLAVNIFKNQPNLLAVQEPVTVVGDLHGQFYDFLRLIQSNIGGEFGVTNYVFLGDYVDRGNFSIQVLILVLCLKITYPNNVILLRGNHECRQLTSFFSFRHQCLFKYDQQTYQRVMDLFDTFPIACIINGKFLALHGGLSPQLINLSDIQKIDRFHQIPKAGLFCDLVWADPISTQPTGRINSLGLQNKARGCSYYFGVELASSIFQRNKLMSVIRAHELQQQGYKVFQWGLSQFPTVVTVFSAPNYCDYYDNKAAVVKFANGLCKFQTFQKSPHPYLLPNFMDLFSFSIPFLVEKVHQMLHHVIKPYNNFKAVQMPMQLSKVAELLQKHIMIQQKVALDNLSMVKEENLENKCPDQRLWQTGQFYQTINASFETKKKIDQINQSRPNEY